MIRPHPSTSKELQYRPKARIQFSKSIQTDRKLKFYDTLLHIGESCEKLTKWTHLSSFLREWNEKLFYLASRPISSSTRTNVTVVQKSVVMFSWIALVHLNVGNRNVFQVLVKAHSYKRDKNATFNSKCPTFGGAKKCITYLHLVFHSSQQSRTCLHFEAQHLPNKWVGHIGQIQSCGSIRSKLNRYERGLAFWTKRDAWQSG